MKVAIVHDSLMEFGGAERVLQTLLKIWPKADVFTSAVSLEVIKNFPKIRIKTSFLDKIPYLKKKTSFLQLFAPFIWPRLNLEKYDYVISNSSFGLANTIRVKKPIHIAYIQTPPKNLFGLTEKWGLQKIIPYTFFLANYYQKAVRKNPHILVNSRNIAGLMKKLFDIETKVIYPPVIIPKNSFSSKEHRENPYFVTTSRMDKEKGIQMAIEACNQLKLPLKIIGQGRMFNQLKEIAGPTIEFLGFVSDKKLASVYQEAQGFLFCHQNEDFGIAPVEAMGYGLPVIAYYGGGLKETMVDSKTGLFFKNYDVNSLIQVLKKFSGLKFDQKLIRKHAQKFSEEKFIKEFKKNMAEAYCEHLKK